MPITDLCRLGKKHKTDKPDHGYTRVYFHIMKAWKDRPVSLFEIGIYRGDSLRMWQEYFVKGKIFGIDNGRKLPDSEVRYSYRNENPSKDDLRLLQTGQLSKHNKFDWVKGDRIKCFIADQRSSLQLRNALSYFKYKRFNFIIDDGQHYQEHQQKSLGLLFKNVKPNGYYIIEDVCCQSLLLQGCYWGQRKKDCSDSTDAVFREFIKTGKLNSIYLSKEEAKYIESNTEDVFMYDAMNKIGRAHV